MIKRLCFAFMALMIQTIYADDIHIWDFINAAEDGELFKVKSLVSRNVLNFGGEYNQWAVDRALQGATTNGHLEVVRYLVNNIGANVNYRYGKNPRANNTILFEAADKGHLAIVQILVSKGANTNRIGECGYAPLYDSANDAIWDYLQPKTKELSTALAFINAARRGNLEQVKSFLEQLKKEGKDINDIKVNANNSHCETSALIEASYYGHLEVVKFLVENGANVNNNVAYSAGNSKKDTALISASANGHLEVVKYLVENGASVNNGPHNALAMAAEEGHLAVVRYLVSQGADVKIKLYSVVGNGHFEVAKYLISQGADIRGALQGAIARGDLGFVKYALSQGVDLTKDSVHINTNGHIYTSLNIKTQAEKNKYLANIVEITRLLIANGAKIYESGLIDAVEPTKYTIDSRDTYPYYFEIVKMLVNNGANVNYQNKSGKTALMYAVRNSTYIDITQYLLQHGASASINVVDERGETALDMALGEKQIALLKRYGAKYNKRRKSSNSPKAPPNVHIQNHKSDSPRNAPRFPPNVHIRIID